MSNDFAYESSFLDSKGDPREMFLIAISEGSDVNKLGDVLSRGFVFKQAEMSDFEKLMGESFVFFVNFSRNGASQ